MLPVEIRSEAGLKWGCWNLEIKACNVMRKETPKQVFFCDFCDVFKNTLFTDYTRDTPFVLSENLGGEKHIQNVRFHLVWSLRRKCLHKTFPLDWNSPCLGEGASHQQFFTRVRQREELNWASQLKSSDQQISSTIMSRPESTLIRQD